MNRAYFPGRYHNTASIDADILALEGEGSIPPDSSQNSRTAVFVALISFCNKTYVFVSEDR